MKKVIEILFFLMFSLVQAQNRILPLFVGTYTNNCESKGIYVLDFDTQTANFTIKNSTENSINPSYLSLSKNQKKLYAVNENGKQSTISSFSYQSENGKLTLLNMQAAEGLDPCYIINDQKHAIVANYSSGSLTVFGITPDGSLTPAKQIVQHQGKSVHPRQESAHAHMVYFSPDKKYVLSNDLGTDSVYIYEYHPNESKAILKLKNRIAVAAGSGPRHLQFSKKGDYLYVLQELSGAITVFKFDKGTIQKIQEISILAKDFKGNFTAADIHISPDGHYLYASNRGDSNTISIFSILKNGLLEAQNIVSSLGKGPRNFVIDPTGNYLLVAHQYSNEIVVFKRDSNSGALNDTGKRIPLCSPVCLVFGN